MTEILSAGKTSLLCLSFYFCFLFQFLFVCPVSLSLSLPILCSFFFIFDLYISSFPFFHILNCSHLTPHPCLLHLLSLHPFPHLSIIPSFSVSVFLSCFHILFNCLSFLPLSLFFFFFYFLFHYCSLLDAQYSVSFPFFLFLFLLPPTPHLSFLPFLFCSLLISFIQPLFLLCLSFI